MGTMVYHVLELLAIFSSLLQPVELRLGVRNKRVLYGLPARQQNRDAYDIFRYYVFLSKTQPSWVERKFFNWFWNERKALAPDPDDLVCGGSLLTPSIIQTAAHCVAVLVRAVEGNMTELHPKNVWENYMYSYVGGNVVTKMVDWLKPKHYLTYQGSRWLQGSAQYIMYDFGLILTKSAVNEKAPNAAISYVPVYRGADNLQFYYDAMSKEYMCLHVGHGYWDIPYYRNPGTDEEDDIPVISNKPSDPIRWGWRTLMNYIDCEFVTYDPLERKEFYFNYTQDATWVCSQPFRHSPRGHEFQYHTGEGDSGGPVACNNVHFAVIHGGSTETADDVITYYSPIVYTTFENAAEYRDNFIEYCNMIRRDEQIPNPVYPDFTVTPPADHPFPLSQSPPLTPVHHSLLIWTTIYFIWHYNIYHSEYLILWSADNK